MVTGGHLPVTSDEAVYLASLQMHIEVTTPTIVSSLQYLYNTYPAGTCCQFSGRWTYWLTDQREEGNISYQVRFPSRLCKVKAAAQTNTTSDSRI